MTYAARIAKALEDAHDGTPTPALCALVERLMRDEHGTLDHLTGPMFARQARWAYGDALWWADSTVDGVTLGEYCAANQLTNPFPTEED